MNTEEMHFLCPDRAGIPVGIYCVRAQKWLGIFGKLSGEF